MIIPDVGTTIYYISSFFTPKTARIVETKIEKIDRGEELIYCSNGDVICFDELKSYGRTLETNKTTLLKNLIIESENRIKEVTQTQNEWILKYKQLLKEAIGNHSCGECFFLETDTKNNIFYCSRHYCPTNKKLACCEDFINKEEGER